MTFLSYTDSGIPGAAKTSLENKHLRKLDYCAIDKVATNGLVGALLKKENKRLTVVCSCCR